MQPSCKDVITVSSAEDSADSAMMACVVHIVNMAYARGEERMWKGGAERTNVIEMVGHLDAGNVLIAQRSEMNEITGCIYVDNHFSSEPMTGELGMISVGAEHLGWGLGNRLLMAAEEHCRQSGCLQMRLEILSPRDYVHPMKQWLDVWYQHIGYSKGLQEDFGKAFPRIAPLLACNCVFTVYLKILL